MNRISTRIPLLIAALAFAAPAGASDPILRADVDVNGSSTSGSTRDNDLLSLIEDVVELKGDFGPPLAVEAFVNGYVGTFDYLGWDDAIRIEVDAGGLSARIIIPETGLTQAFTVTNPNALYDEIEDWVKDAGAKEWFDFLREANAHSPLAVTSGNPKSTVALLGSSAYRRFGFDDSRSRFGYQTQVGRYGGLDVRLDIGGSSLDVEGFDDLWTVDPSLMIAGNFGKLVGLSFTVIGQYRNYDGAKIGDLGLELALPLTFLRPDDKSSWYWQLTPVIQAGAGFSKNLAAGGLIMGGGLVNGVAKQFDSFEVLMANEILYYGGIPTGDIGGYDFETDLSQLYFRNGVEATWYPGMGIYLDVGIHFSNFAIDDAAVNWYATPAVGFGWQAGRWMDIRVSYEPDLAPDDYLAHTLQLKLDFLF
ncbi:MAG: hypothetical protein JRG90_14595 [Deltaproteobacteria bacterium]|nr:hypothetical protein [Deltaproteobacteria bacterium]MBW2668033.1 hypothetical protein [Deltaproteobacteria bacterium]